MFFEKSYLSGLGGNFGLGSHFNESFGESGSGFEVFQLEKGILRRLQRVDQVRRLQLAVRHVGRHLG